MLHPPQVNAVMPRGGEGAMLINRHGLMSFTNGEQV